ncbi:hypothetical protein CLV88_12327 [Shimia abyssi]|uniref:Uncharacterized protein n=1 Tax=Shimia abyssi TaxID=1662395 RepID=A0A2P8F2W6_9RHOB|nr:hypothetical protein CLV88_12327 [Shimia abyssi]
MRSGASIASSPTGLFADLSYALNDAATKPEATTIIRSLLSEIRLIPDGGKLSIELVGELAGLLSLVQTKTASESVSQGRSVTMVAGGRYQRYLLHLTSSGM